MHVGGWVCCIVGADGSIPLTMLADVCQCRLLCLYAYRFSRHFPYCKTWWTKNLNLNCTTEGERQAGIWQTAATLNYSAFDESQQTGPAVGSTRYAVSVARWKRWGVSLDLSPLGRLRSLSLISHCLLYDCVCITSVACCHCMIVFVGYCQY